VHPEQLKAPAHISEGKIIASTAKLVETLEDAAERSSSPGRACRPGGRKASDRRGNGVDEERQAAARARARSGAERRSSLAPKPAATARRRTVPSRRLSTHAGSICLIKRRVSRGSSSRPKTNRTRGEESYGP